jgi:predicted transcriptional regulator
MRTLIDLKEEEVAALDAQAKREGVSRAALMRQAIAEFLGRIGSPDEDAGFGAWKRDARPAIDGLAHQEKLRREW